MKKFGSFSPDGERYAVLKKSIFIMRITLIILIITTFNLYATGTYSQTAKVSLQLNQVSIKQVLKEIEKSSEFYFLYNDNLVDVDKSIDIEADNQQINTILNQLFDSKEIKYEVYDRQIVISPANMPLPQEAQRKISGKVTDTAGTPIPGISVIAKGTTIGTTTSNDGRYSLVLPVNTKILLFSFIGLQSQEVILSSQTTLDIVMQEETVGVDEVVVIGYGTQKKSNLTATVEMVNTKVLQNRPLKTVGEMLQGTVPNLNVTSSSGAPDAIPTFNIRGFTGFGTSGAPLILVDGAEQNINLVNADDIENISVLKDAAASAIYGSRAPNGVILITTKTGKKGKKMSLTYSGNISINQPIGVPNSATSVDFAKYLNMSHYNELVAPFYGDAVIQRMQDYIDGKITANNIIVSNGRWGEHTDANANTDYYGYAFKNHSYNSSHNLAISGGTDNTSYYVGISSLAKDGIYNSKIDNYGRYSMMSKINTDITDWLHVNVNARYSRELTERPNFRGASSATSSDQDFWNNLAYFPNIPIFNPDGTYHRLSAMPVLEGLQGKINNTMDDIMLSGGFVLNPLKGLSIKGNYSWNVTSSVYNQTTLQYYVTEPNGEVLRSARSATLDKVYEKHSSGAYSAADITATYDKTIKKHIFSAMAGFNQELRKYFNLIGQNQDLYTTSLPTLSTAYGTNIIADDEIGVWATRGYFFRGSYNYDGKYLLDFNARYDAASKYPPETRWAFFPSVSFGYNIAKEKFWPVKQINSLKLTGSWGKLGELSSGNYLYLPTMGTFAKTSTVLGGILPPYVTIPGLVSPTLTWAKPRTIGYGVEMSAIQNKLNIDYHWYQRTTFDQLGPAVQLPEVLGTDPPQTNNSVSETRGWELSLGWRDQAFSIAGSPLRYEVNFSMSDYIGYVVKYQDNITGTRSGWTPGQIFGEVYGWANAGIAGTKSALQNSVLPGTLWYYQGDLMYKDLNGDGRIDNGIGNLWYSQGDREVFGYNYPRYRYNSRLSLGWKDFDLSILLDGVGKEVMYVNNNTVFGQTGGWSGRTQNEIHTQLDYWTLSTPDAFFPRIYRDSKNFGSPNDKYLLNLAHLEIKNVNLNYSLPKKWANKLKLSSVSCNLSIENLGMIYYKSWLKLHPTQLEAGGVTYPLQRVYSFGLKLGI